MVDAHCSLPTSSGPLSTRKRGCSPRHPCRKRLHVVCKGRDEDGARTIHFKLADLGVAKLLSEVNAHNTRADWMLPPEVLNPTEFGPTDHRIDIYHIGLLLLQFACSRQLSFTRDEILAGQPREMAARLSPPFNFALEKTLRRHVAFRTSSAMELWRDLRAPAPALPPTQLFALPPPNSPPPRLSSA